MATNLHTDTEIELYADLIDTLAEAGFSSLQDSEDDDFGAGTIAGTRRATADYFLRRGWDAYRVEPSGFTFCRFGEEVGIEILRTTTSGVTTAQARLDLSRQGVAWTEKMLAA